MPLFRFAMPIRVKEEDVNYRNHVAHEKYFLFFQMARNGYLDNLGYTVRDIHGYSMIIADARCTYKNELRLGDDIEVQCRVSEIKPKAFVMAYQILREGVICATGATTNLCFDYGEKKVVSIPALFVQGIKDYEAFA